MYTCIGARQTGNNSNNNSKQPFLTAVQLYRCPSAYLRFFICQWLGLRFCSLLAEGARATSRQRNPSSVISTICLHTQKYIFCISNRIQILKTGLTVVSSSEIWQHATLVTIAAPPRLGLHRILRGLESRSTTRAINCVPSSIPSSVSLTGLGEATVLHALVSHDGSAGELPMEQIMRA